jgi:acylphosphatase
MVTPSPDATTACWQARVVGRVQGVGYREACVREARRLGVAGWVRNRRDGSVEAMLQGPTAALSALRAWMERGPPLAAVLRVDITPVDSPGAPFTEFERRPTA